MGTYWYKFYVDVHSQVDVDVDCGTIAPWRAQRPDYGETLNWPVELTLHGVDKEYFLGAYQGRLYDQKQFKDFQANFPEFTGTDLRQLIPYLGKVAQYCSGYAVFCPVPSSYRYRNKLGLWFDELPEAVRSDAISKHGHILATVLLNPKKGIINNTKFGPSLRHEQSGYDILYRLAFLGGHPQLVDFAGERLEPKQGEDDPISEYIYNWEYYLLIAMLDGTHYSDRYVLHRLIRGIHRSLKPLATFLETKLAPFNSPDSVHRPIPDSLRPADLVLTLQQFCADDGKLSWTVLSPRQISAASFSRDRLSSSKLSPRPFSSRPPAPSSASSASGAGTIIRELHTAPAPATDSDSPLTDDEQYEFRLCALTNSGGTNPSPCFWCQKTDHRMSDCAWAKKAATDPRAARAIRSFLANANGPSPSPSPAGKPIRQVSTDDPAPDPDPDPHASIPDDSLDF